MIAQAENLCNGRCIIIFLELRVISRGNNGHRYHSSRRFSVVVGHIHNHLIDYTASCGYPHNNNNMRTNTRVCDITRRIPSAGISVRVAKPYSI